MTEDQNQKLEKLFHNGHLWNLLINLHSIKAAGELGRKKSPADGEQVNCRRSLQGRREVNKGESRGLES